MINTKFLSLLTIVLLVFASCSSEDSLIEENLNLSLEKTYKVKRDATGAYSLDFDQNTKIDEVLKFSDDFRQYLLSSSSNNIENTNSHELLIDNNKLKIGFIDADLNKTQSILILDDNVALQSKSNETKKLVKYSIKSNQDDTFSLDFKVKKNVDVSFVYNEEIRTYEIHLEDGDGVKSNFSRTFDKESSEPLRIDFVNHLINSNAKSSSLLMIRKPKIIIDDD